MVMQRLTVFSGFSPVGARYAAPKSITMAILFLPVTGASLAAD